MPHVYFWLMGEILFFYMLTAFVVCYFFRKFCQDPTVKAQMLKEEDEEAAYVRADKVLGSEVKTQTIFDDAANPVTKK